MRRLLFSLLFLMISGSGFAQYSIEYPGNRGFGAHYHYGFMIAHRPGITHLQQQHLQGFELNWQHFSNDTSGWRNTFGFPWLGLTYMNFDLGNSSELGHAHGIFSTVYFPLVRRKPLSLMFRMGWGLGYIERPFNTEDNYKNLAIGSNLNIGMNIAILFRVPASKRVQFTGGLNFTHYSNGSSQLPNLGLNITTVQAGVQYFAGPPQKRTKYFLNEKRPGVDYSFAAVAGVKDIYPPGDKKYVPVNVSFNVLKDFTSKSMFGAGTEFGYDASMQPRLEEEDREGTASCVRAGIHVTYGLHVGKLYGLFQVGTYLYNPMTLDGDVYNRIAFRYYTSKHFFLHASLKSHYAKADYIEWGFGYSFRG